MFKVGIMGGTFDPIHCGHLLAAESAREACELDEVWFIPANCPPLKGGKPGADGAVRLEMVRLAIGGNPCFRAMDTELRRGGVSYSVDTAATLQQEYPDREFYYIVGSDRINDLPSWHRIEELAAIVRFIGLERPGAKPEPDGLPEYLRQRISFVEMPQIDISSTDIRRRRSEGRSIRYLVPDAVYHFMIRNGLYEA